VAGSGAGPGARSEDTPGVITFPPLIYLIAILCGWALEQAWATPAVPTGWRLGLGGALSLAAVALALWAVPQFLRLKTNVSVHRPATALITLGPYRFTRNPLYLALALLHAGLGITAGLGWILLLLPAALLVVHHGVIRREERYLECKFGRDYLDYKARVRRWL